MAKRKFPVTVKRGSVAVKIYRTPTKGCDSYTVAYWQDGVRKRSTFASYDKAEQEAEQTATRLNRGELDVLTLTSADRAAYLRAKQLFDEVGVPFESGAAQFAEAKRKLGDVSLLHTVDYYLKKHPRNLKPQPVQKVVDEFLQAKQNDGMSERYLQSLRYDLGKFARAFRCSILSVTGEEINMWLRSLKISNRTRNNIRGSVQTLFNYAKTCKYLPKDHDEIAAVSMAKDSGGEIEIFTPQEMSDLLRFAPSDHIPFLALGAFAGVRHAESQRLDWSDIHFDAEIVELKAGKAKTASRRTIPILDNLRAWLLPYAQRCGPICKHRNMAFELAESVRKVNHQLKKEMTGRTVKWKHNALRHSFISYRVADIQNVNQVALEAGNSPQMIFRNYRELVRPADAKKWFAIRPNAEDNVTKIPTAVA